MSIAFEQQPEDALIPKPELPPRVSIDTVQRSSPPYVSNQNIFAVLLKNKRQITSLTAGNTNTYNFFFLLFLFHFQICLCVLCCI